MNYDLDRFIDAQKKDYEKALFEIKNGKKQSHWIWFVFPQLVGLGKSATSLYYGIKGVEEARAYIRNEELRNNLLKISEALLKIESNHITDIMGYPDDLKLHSSMTLFALIAPKYDVFQKVLDKFYNGKMDINTVNLIKNEMDRYL